MPHKTTSVQCFSVCDKLCCPSTAWWLDIRWRTKHTAAQWEQNVAMRVSAWGCFFRRGVHWCVVGAVHETPDNIEKQNLATSIDGTEYRHVPHDTQKPGPFFHQNLTSTLNKIKPNLMLPFLFAQSCEPF